MHFMDCLLCPLASSQDQSLCVPQEQTFLSLLSLTPLVPRTVPDT